MVSLLTAYLAAPVFKDAEKTRIAGLLNITLLAVSVTALILTLAEALAGVADSRILLVGLVTAILPIILRFVAKRGRVRFASLLLSSLFLINVTLAIFFAGTIRSPLATIYIVGIVIAGLMVSYRAAIAFTVLSALALLGLLWAETAGLLNPIPVTVGMAQWLAYVATYVVVTVLVGLTIDNINGAFSQARRNEFALSRTVAKLQVTTQKFREAEAKYRMLVEHIPAITYIDVPDVAVASGYRSVYISPQMTDILGYTPTQLLEEPDLWLQLIHPADREAVSSLRARHFETGFPFQHEYRVVASDGTVVWLRDAAVSVRDEAGKLQFSQGVQFDITEQKQTEEALRHSEARYRAVIDQSKDCIFLVDLNSKLITEANPAMQRLLGYTAAEMKDLSLYDFIAHEYDTIDRNIERVLADGYYYIGERQYYRKDGSLVDLAVSVSVISYEGRQILCVVSRTIGDRKRAQAALLTRARQQAVIAELGQRGLVNMDLSLFMDEVVALIAHALEVDFVSILELIPERNQLLLRAGKGWPSDFIGHETLGLNGDQHESGYALLCNSAVVVNDFTQETRFEQSSLLRDHDVAGSAAVVIFGQNRPYGILSVHTKARRKFGEDSIYFLQATANVLAANIEHKQAETEIFRRQQELLALQSAGAAITSSLDLHEVLNTVAEAICTWLGVTGCTISEWNPADDTITTMIDFGPIEWSDKTEPGTAFNLADYPLTKQVLVERQAHQLTSDQPNADMAELAYMALVEIDTLLMLPMIFQDQVIGLVEIVDDWSTRIFTDQEIALGQLLANQAASSIKNARLYEQAQQEIAERKRAETEIIERNMQLLVLQSAGAAITSTLDLQDVLITVAREMRNLLSVAVCTVYEWDQTGDIITTMLRVGPETWSSEDIAGQAYSLAKFPFAQRVLAEQLPQQVTIDQPANDAAVFAYMRAQGFKTLLMLPMVYQQRVVGLLEAVDVDDVVTFTRHQIALGQLLANQAASSIENARLYTASQRSLAQQSAFREAGAIISSTLNLDSVLRIIAEQMGQVIDATSAYICGFEGETKTETVLAEYIGPSACPLELESVLGNEYIEDDDEFVASLQLNQPSYSHIDDPDLHPSNRKHMQQYGAKSILYVPFQIKNQPIGFAELWDSRHKREFSGEEVVLCRALADQAAIAIEKARLFEQAQNEILERKRAEEQIKMSLKEKEVLLQEIHHRVKNNMQVISSLLNLQSGYVQDQQILEILKDSQNRVRSMALIHEKLYRSENLAQIDFGEYVRDLAADLFRSSGAQSEKVALEVRVDNVFLDIDTAVPSGLILNELVSNSLKHAFPKDRTGDLLVELRAGPGDVLQLKVADNGVGFPQKLDYHQLDSLGLQLVTSLVEQLDGSIELDPTGGTDFQIRFRRSNLSGTSHSNGSNA